jgi:hypothetical protein
MKNFSVSIQLIAAPQVLAILFAIIIILVGVG